jgi:uncharacterized membrane protein YgcG
LETSLIPISAGSQIIIIIIIIIKLVAHQRLMLVARTLTYLEPNLFSLVIYYNGLRVALKHEIFRRHRDLTPGHITITDGGGGGGCGGGGGGCGGGGGGGGMKLKKRFCIY